MANSNWQNYYGVVYKIIDTANGLVYIGQTIRDLKSRFKDHLKYPSNKFLKKAFDRYNYKLKMNYNNAKDEYFWKPRILSLIKKYDLIHIVARIAEGFNIPDPTVRGAIKRIWKCELEKLGGIRALLEYLKEK